MISFNQTTRTIVFTPNTQGRKKGQEAIEKKVISAHFCPACTAPIQIIVLTNHDIDPCLFDEVKVSSKNNKHRYVRPSGGPRYETWTVENGAGIAAVTWLAKDHLSDWCLPDTDDGHGPLLRKRPLYGRFCPMIAFFSPSPSEQVRKFLSLIAYRRIYHAPEKDPFSIIVRATEKLEILDNFQIIKDPFNHFHPMFALDPSDLTKVIWLRRQFSNLLEG